MDNNRFSLYRRIRHERTFRTLGKMSWWRVVLGTALLVSILFFTGILSRPFAARGEFRTARALLLFPSWMEHYHPEDLAYLAPYAVAAHFKDFAVVDNPLRTKLYPDMPLTVTGCYLGDGFIDFERILRTLIEKAPHPRGMMLLAEPAYKLPTNDAERDDRVEYNRKISRQYVAKMLEIVERF